MLHHRESARKQKHEQFVKQFAVRKLPRPQQFRDFLSSQDLNCLIAQNAAMKRGFIGDASSISHRIFCLPVSERIADGFIGKLAEYIRQSTCKKISLYWSCQRVDGHIAWRIVIKKTGGTALIASELLYPADGGVDHHHPITEFESRLQGKLSGQVLATNDCKETPETYHIDEEAYWAALSLFIDLSQTDPRYQQQFIDWQLMQPLTIPEKIQKEAMVLFNLVAYLNAPLYYGEQARLIVTMPLIQQRLGNRHLPTMIQHLPLRPILHGLVWGFMIYQRQYFTLAHLPLIYGFNKLTPFMMRASRESHAHIVLFYLCQLLTIASHMAFGFYMALPNSTIERAIIAPGYLFSWATLMAQEAIKLGIKLLGLVFFYGGMNKLLSPVVLADPNNQAGFFAIAVLFLQAIMPLLDAYLFTFTAWKGPQRFEAEILTLLEYQCRVEYNCTLSITTPLVQRVLQQSLSSNQQLHIEATSIDGARGLDCDLNISTASPPCLSAQLSCTARLFSETSKKALIVRGAQVEPLTYEFRSC